MVKCSSLALLVSALNGCAGCNETGASAIAEGDSDASVASDASTIGDAGFEQRWTRLAVQQERLVTGNIALMIDDAGVAHVAYTTIQNGDRSLRHAWIQGKDVRTEQVDLYGRGWLKGWVAGSSQLRLVYDSRNYAISTFHAVRDGDGQWAVEVMRPDEPSAAATAVWHEDRLLLARLSALQNESGWLHRLELDGELMAGGALAPAPILPMLEIAVDGAGKVHVVYSAPLDSYQGPPSPELGAPLSLKYASFQNGAWGELATLTPYPGHYVGLSLALDSKEGVHVLFSELGSYPEPDGSFNAAFEIHHLSKGVGKEWDRELVPAGSANVADGSLAVDADGNVHLVYCTVGDDPPRCDGVAYAVKRGGTWSQEPIESGCPSLGHEAALALGRDGSVHVAYRGCDGMLTSATRSDSQ
jgi:hypothetical protein